MTEPAKQLEGPWIKVSIPGPLLIEVDAPIIDTLPAGDVEHRGLACVVDKRAQGARFLAETVSVRTEDGQHMRFAPARALTPFR